MRYTRYEYKTSGKLKFLITVAVIAGMSVCGGLYISNFIFKGNELTQGNNLSYSTDENLSIGNSNIVALQCGYYSKKENADTLLATLSSYCQPFSVEENGNYRVIAGMYNEENGLKKLEEFKSQGIEVTKVNLDILSDTLDNKKIIEVVDGFLQITSKFEESDVQSIKTSEFKTWADKIINDGNNIESDKVKKIDDFIKILPDDINKNNSAQNVQILYNIVKN